MATIRKRGPIESERRVSSCQRCKDFCRNSDGIGLEYVDDGAYSGYRPCVACVTRKRIARIPPLYADVRLENLVADPERHPLQGEVIPYLQANPGHSYFFEGDAGTGKTHFARALFRHAIESYRPRVRAITLVELLDQYRRRIREPEYIPDVTAEQVRDSKPGDGWTIFLDDVDKANPTEYAAQETFSLLNAIIEHRQQLIVTTNKRRQDLADHFERSDIGRGPAIVRRMIDGAKIVELWRHR